MLKKLFTALPIVITTALLFAACTPIEGDLDTIKKKGGTRNPASTSYTVTFDINGASGTVPAPQTVKAGSPVELPGGSGLSRGTDTFGGWNTDADGEIGRAHV